ncbi:hypothetical protein [Frankia sp. AgB32]|uniref:hypothetical protein n=1 Tax=Frankia sp. AgB32 TaxID=631119 RepID=UPI00200C407B|nr:hypothetical protein [Frankia sp. AgB32]MCK9897734.1 hypothetical protein [Frankia sp. AgB32]
MLGGQPPAAGPAAFGPERGVAPLGGEQVGVASGGGPRLSVERRAGGAGDGRGSARLVSATPDPGWQVPAWQADGWLRVDFSHGGTTSSCFVTWNGHPPTVQTT